MNYIIPIGGTGVRVMKAIVYLAMAECFDKHEKFKVMCVDSDESNGDIKKLEEIMNTYHRLVGYDTFPEIISADVDKSVGKKLVWSPLSTDRVNATSSMATMVGESLMSDKGKDIFRFLYTKEEREKVLEGGFYGHTSIGSYFMSQQIKDGDDYTTTWKNFFDGINATRDKIFIIGSVFGGTGASGVPTIARIIKETEITKDVPIGAILVQPYFKPVVKTEEEVNDLTIDWNTFTTKTKTALSYYTSQGYDEIFKIMYFIGEDDDEKFMVVDNNDCGNKQVNKANIIELFSATALLDFIKSDLEDISFTAKFTMKEVKPDGIHTIITPNLLNVHKLNVFSNLKTFFKFSVLFTRYYYYLIMKNEMDKGFEYSDIQPSDADKMREACVSFITWIREMLVNTDSDGNIDYTKDNENINWLRSDLIELYTYGPLKTKPSGFGPFKSEKIIYSQLDDMSKMLKNSENELKGEEIIDRLVDWSGKGGLKEFLEDFKKICI